MSKIVLNVNRNVLIGLLLSMVLAVTMIGMVGRGMLQIEHNADQLVHSNTVMDVMDSLMMHMSDVETGERGYIITGDDSYLAPHEHGLEMVHKQRAELARLLVGEPFERDWLAELDQRLAAKVAISRANVQARKQGFEAARARVLEGAGKREMDALREILGRMSKAQSERRDELRSKRNEMMGDLELEMLIVAVLFIAALSYFQFRVSRMAKLIHQGEQQAIHSAAHDVLTGLPNRRLMLEHLHHAMQRCVRHKKELALLFLDLNGFKLINDKYGHKAGDEVLKQAARRLSGAMRASDMVARLGGDEFVVLVEDIAAREDVCDIVRKINAAIGRPIPLEGAGEIAVSISIGVAVYPRDGEDVEVLLSVADAAMYEAKRRQSNCYCMEQGQLPRCVAGDAGENPRKAQ